MFLQRYLLGTGARTIENFRNMTDAQKYKGRPTCYNVMLCVRQHVKYIKNYFD